MPPPIRRNPAPPPPQNAQDASLAAPHPTWKAVIRQLRASFVDDDVLGRSAQLAYYFFFALFPGLIFVSSMIGLLAGGTRIDELLLRSLSTVIPPSAFGLVQDTFHQITRSSGAGKLTFGVLVALWSATSGMSAAQDTLNGVYKVTEGRPFWKARLIALGLTLAVSVLIIVALTALFCGEWLIKLFAHQAVLGPATMIGGRLIEWLLALFLFSLVFATTYYWAPDVDQRRWQWITPGAAIGLIAWILASLALRVYLHFFNSYSVTYGSLGAVIILLTWFYISGLVLLAGAEINAAVEDVKAQQGHPSAKHKGEKSPRGGRAA